MVGVPIVITMKNPSMKQAVKKLVSTSKVVMGLRRAHQFAGDLFRHCFVIQNMITPMV
jgi:hypothetical protein